MAHYKFLSFNVTGLGEPIRFLLSYGGLSFEDARFTFDDWPQLKPNVPFGQLPVLELNGKQVNQSVSIARYVAKQVKLVGNNDWENLEIDAVVDTLVDLRTKLGVNHFETDEALKASRREVLIKETVPYYLDKLEDVAKKNNGHLALGKLTWADVYFAAILDTLDFFCGADIIADYPNLQAVKDKVFKLPQIKAWLEKRPKTKF